MPSRTDLVNVSLDKIWGPSRLASESMTRFSSADTAIQWWWLRELRSWPSLDCTCLSVIVTNKNRPFVRPNTQSNLFWGERPAWIFESLKPTRRIRRCNNVADSNFFFLPGIAQWSSDFSKQISSFSKVCARTVFVIASKPIALLKERMAQSPSDGICFWKNRGGFPPVSKEISSLRVIGVGAPKPNTGIEVIPKEPVRIEPNDSIPEENWFRLRRTCHLARWNKLDKIENFFTSCLENLTRSVLLEIFPYSCGWTFLCSLLFVLHETQSGTVVIILGQEWYNAWNFN